MVPQSTETTVQVERSKIPCNGDEPVDAIRQQHPSKWLVIEVTEETEYLEPIRGILLGHGPTPEAVSPIVRQHLGKPIAVFYNATPEEREGTAVMI